MTKDILQKQRLPVILASSSPRRRYLLKKARINFKTMNIDLDEDLLLRGANIKSSPYFGGRRLVRKIAEMKASKVSNKKSVIITADTLVVTKNGIILGKPANSNDALQMLSLLSGKMHYVHTGVTIKYNSKIFSFVESAKVFFRKINQEELLEYVKTGEGLDKAGAYAYQGIGRKFIKKVKGDEETVIGLPTKKIIKILKKIK